MDQSFNVAAGALSASNRYFAPRVALQSDGKILITTESGGLVGLLCDGQRDPAFASRNLALGAPPAPDGSLLVGSTLIAANGAKETSPNLGVGFQPRRVSLTPGKLGIVYLRLASSSQPTKAMWVRNGLPLPTDGSGVIRSAEAWFLDFGFVHAAQAGTYAVTMSDYLGQTATSDPIEVTVGNVARFVNLSTRAQVGNGEQAPILGFVIPPGQYRQVILRGIGPALTDFGVAGALADPRLDLYDGAGRVVARSDGWQASIIFEDPIAAFAKVGAFPLSAGSRDAGLIVGLNPGSYTARLSGVGNTTGVGLIELYEADNNSDRLINISSRVYVGNSPAPPAMAGFSIQGAVAKRVLVRAAGPALAAFGVDGSMANPRLEIRDFSGAVVASNDDWQNQVDATTVATGTVNVGAFAFAAGSKDSALVLSLRAGNYTALVSAADGGSGVVLIEAYEVP